MSATQQRRAIRRAFGPEAADLIREQQELITGHHLAIADLIKSRDALAERVRVAVFEREQVDERLGVRIAHFEQLHLNRPRTFWGRLRWLVKG